MTVFLGAYGAVRLRRNTGKVDGTTADTISPSDVNTSLNRVGLQTSLDNLLTGDRLDLETSDPRGLVCFDASAWSSGSVQNSLTAYINVNAAGGLRFFPTFDAAVNNNRSSELQTYAFNGADLSVAYTVRDTNFNLLGNVTGYTLNTDREAIDTTALTDTFRSQYSAGLLSGNGSINCLFDSKTTGLRETPLLMLQLIQRLDIGSAFDCAFYLTDSEVDPVADTVFYQTTALITRSGVEVGTEGVITCVIDFVTTGEIRLLLGRPADYILKEDDDRVKLEQSLDFLLQETAD